MIDEAAVHSGCGNGYGERPQDCKRSKHPKIMASEGKSLQFVGHPMGSLPGLKPCTAQSAAHLLQGLRRKADGQNPPVGVDTRCTGARPPTPPVNSGSTTSKGRCFCSKLQLVVRLRPPHVKQVSGIWFTGAKDGRIEKRESSFAALHFNHA